jgi:DNA (cytosine-5)-methyltransferase 1
VADYGVPQSRRRFVLLAGHDFDITIPRPTHARDGKNGLIPWRTVQDVIKTMPEPITLNEAVKRGDPRRFNWHVIRNMTKVNKLRLENVKPGGARNKLPEELRPDCHKGKDYGFSNVYGRLEWNKPSVTITGGCTTFSKGRFGHPDKDRTISVREAALLQTFPPGYFFDTPYMDHACDIIGNALPCDFAETLAQAVHDALWKQNDSLAKTRQM